MSRELSDNDVIIQWVNSPEFEQAWAEAMARGEGAHLFLIPDPRLRSTLSRQPEQDEDGYYDSSGEWWQDAHHYVPSDTDEVLKLIDETLK